MIETNAHGHRFFYLRLLADGALRIGARPVIWLREDAINESSFIVHLSPLQGLIEIRRLPRRAGVLQSDTRYRKTILRLVQSHLGDQDVVVLPDGDRWLAALLGESKTLLRSCRLLLLRTSIGSRSQKLRMLLKVSAARLLAANGVKVRRLVTAFDTSIEESTGSFAWIPPVADPLPEVHRTPMHEARAALGLPQGRTIGLVAGAIDERKSTSELLQWLESSLLTPRPVLVLAGQLSDGVQMQLRQFAANGRPGRETLRAENQYLENSRLDLYYSATDVVLVLHENEGPSGALAYAAAHGKPVVAWGSRAVVDAVARADLGVVIDDRSPTSIDDAIASVTVESHTQQINWYRGGIHTREGFLLSLLA